MKKIMIFLFCSLSLTVMAAKKVLDIQQWKTSNGVPVYFVETHHVPMLEVRVAFQAGSARDEALSGLAALTATLLNQGNTGLSATKMAEGFETVGAEYSYSVNRDKAVLALTTITEKPQMTMAVDYFAKILQPDFILAAFDREKTAQKAAIASQKEDLDTVAQKALFAAIYPDHPYGEPVLGLNETVQKITLQDVKNFYQQYYVAQNAVITLSGAVDVATAKQLTETIAHNIRQGQKADSLPQAPSLTQAVRKNISYAADQTAIYLGQVGITPHDPNYFALLLGNDVLGGDTILSQLGVEIRGKRGLTYGVYSDFDVMQARGPFTITLTTRTEKAAEALAVTQQVFRDFMTQGPSDVELKQSKQFMTGNFPLNFKSNAAMAGALLTIGFYELPLDYWDTYLTKIQAVTAQQVQAAFKKQLSVDNMAIVVVGKNV